MHPDCRCFYTLAYLRNIIKILINNLIVQYDRYYIRKISRNIYIDMTEVSHHALFSLDDNMSKQAGAKVSGSGRGGVKVNTLPITYTSHYTIINRRSKPTFP